MKRKMFLIVFLVSFLMPRWVLADGNRTPADIAVASNEKAPASAVGDRMGRSPFYLVYDSKRGFIKAIENPNFRRRGRPAGTSMVDSIKFDEKGAMTGGIATPSREERQQTWNDFSKFFQQNGISTVVAEEFGEKIVRDMKAAGIECVSFKGISDDAVQSIVKGAAN
jgi:predicted Fe-Mo cluster-binding NifX family protein